MFCQNKGAIVPFTGSCTSYITKKLLKTQQFRAKRTHKMVRVRFLLAWFWVAFLYLNRITGGICIKNANGKCFLYTLCPLTRRQRVPPTKAVLSVCQASASALFFLARRLAYLPCLPRRLRRSVGARRSVATCVLQ